MYLALFMDIKGKHLKGYIPPHVHMHYALLRPIFEEYKGRGATVASDVTGHRGPKIQ